MKLATDLKEEPIETNTYAFLLRERKPEVAMSANGLGYYPKFDKGPGTLSPSDKTWLRFSECEVIEK